MSFKRTKLAAAFLGLTAASGCVSNEYDARLIGAGVGGYLANEVTESNPLATAAGAAIGAGLAGSWVASQGSCDQYVSGNGAGQPNVSYDCSRTTAFPAAIPTPDQLIRGYGF